MKVESVDGILKILPTMKIVCTVQYNTDLFIYLKHSIISSFEIPLKKISNIKKMTSKYLRTGTYVNKQNGAKKSE